MQTIISDTFTDSLAKLNGEEQKQAKITVFDLQSDPSSPGLRWHKLEKMKDPHFHSVSVNMDIRIIVHKTAAVLALVYIDHHDKAYAWAGRRKLQAHPKTGAAQLVEIRETVQEIVIPKYVDGPSVETTVGSGVAIEGMGGGAKAAPVKLFEQFSDDELLGYGVPEEWLGDVKAATDESLLGLVDYLPAEAGEALLEIATGGKPVVAVAAVAEPVSVGEPDLEDAKPATDDEDISIQKAFEHPDAQRRFRVVNNVEELERALDAPWEKWTVFLHPAQRELVQRSFNGPARVAGSAGTGKTIVALHRAVWLARQDAEAKVLLTTFSEALAGALQLKLRRLVGNEAKVFERIEVCAISDVGRRLYATKRGEPKLAEGALIREMLGEVADGVEENKFGMGFLWAEWREVVDAWQLGTWEAYRDVPRLGRKTRLSEKQRAMLWGIFEQVRERLEERGLETVASVFGKVTGDLAERKHRPFDYAVVDEAQDIGVAELRFLAAVNAMGDGPGFDGDQRPGRLFFAGDLGQRIFQTPFSWKGLGVDIRGRSKTLRINYRTSHQIRRQADRLLPDEISDVDGNKEDRRGTVSVFNSPEPVLLTFDAVDEEVQGVGEWLKGLHEQGFLPQELGVIVRSEAEVARAKQAVEASGLECVLLDSGSDLKAGKVAIATMHLAKGLEFRGVAVMACDDEVVPLQERVESVMDQSDLEEVYNTERHLLYVACTRARDRLLVSGVDPASEFIEDMV